ncbi:heavy-metal-associated domain-containing protein [Mesobacillus foraminis]|uniref:heavy-metal-associated domain-containing protein n=1 Tax=Mesobacillus foraminis TaxID=279826 RepID=UPI001BEAFDAC|nr:heavy-metal-associated domain-containing protein [Mesobacillus foraminis]MBT2757764.1 heavy-metal-associated domain-containing protein [Mesobacillus foraminis]
MKSGVLRIKDIVDQQDADKVLNALLDVWGIERAEVNLNNSNAVFSYDERMASYHDFEQAIIDTGYEILQTGRASTDD